MKRKPAAIWLSSGLIFIAGLSNLFWGNNLGNWITFVAAAVTAVLILEVTAFVLTLIPMVLALLIWRGIHAAQNPNSMGLIIAAFSLIVGLSGAAFLFTNRTRQLFLDPKKRWWRTAKRTVISLGTRISPVTGGDIFAQTFDLSESGVFISLTTPMIREESLPDLTLGAHCSLRINLNQYTYLACSGQIVRTTAGGGKYPIGVGIRFVGLSRGQKENLTSYLRNSVVHPPAIQ